MNPESEIRPLSSVLRPRWPAFLLCIPFLASILFAYCWFNTDIGRSVVPSTRPSDAPPRIWLTAKTNIPGYTFIPEPVSDEVKKILGTTNILNGSFYRSDEHGVTETKNQTSEIGSDVQIRSDISQMSFEFPSRITIFLASWTENETKGLTALLHTPDICWVGSGWNLNETRQYSQLMIRLPIQVDKTEQTIPDTSESSNRWSPPKSWPSAVSAESRLPHHIDSVNAPLNTVGTTFTTRAFYSPDSKRQEIAAWSIFVAGQALPEVQIRGKGVHPPHAAPAAESYERRRRIASQSLQLVMTRLSPIRRRQFVRFSIPLTSDPQNVSAKLPHIARLWLNVDQLSGGP